MSEIRFGTDGWRAVMNDEFVLANVKRVAWAIGRYVTESHGTGSELIVAHDTRFFAEEFAEACARVCTAQGLSVRMAGGPLPTPLTAFSVKHLSAAGAIMLTASHNPAVYNGMKFIPDYAGPATPDITSRIEHALDEAPDPVPLRTGQLVVGELEPYEAYRDHVGTLVDVPTIRTRAPRVVVDPMFGAAQGMLAALLTEFGCAVHEIHNTRDVLFGGSLPDPSPVGLSEAARVVRDGGYALGLGLDGDGDRFGIIDATGAHFAANEMLSLLAIHLGRSRARPGAIVRTVATTHRLDAIGHLLGREVVETPVGFKYVAEQMLERDVLIGGEESGGLSVGGHIPEKDGMLASLLATELFCATGSSMSELMATLDEEVGPRRFSRVDLHVDPTRKEAIMSQLRDSPPGRLGQWAVRDTRTVDGVKLVAEGDRWLLVRPSGTEPVLRVYAEAESPESLQELLTFAERELS